MKINSDKLSQRQILLFFALFCPVAQMLVMPSSYTFFGGRDSWIGVLVQVAVDTIFALLLLFTVQKDDRPFFEILSDGLGETVARAVYFLYFAFFAVKCFMPVFEGVLLCHDVLYESSPSFVFFLPIFLLLFFTAKSGFSPLFRSVELFFPVVLFASLSLIALSVLSADFSRLLPILEFGGYPLGFAMLRHIGWFGDFTLLLVLSDKTDKSEGLAKKGTFGFVLGGLNILLFFVIATAVFGLTSPQQIFMLSKISKYSIVFSNLGRIDFVLIAILLLADILYASVLFNASIHAFITAIPVKKEVPSAILTTAILLLCYAFLEKSFLPISFIEDYSMLLFVPMQYLLPILFPVISIATRRKRRSAVESSS